MGAINPWWERRPNERYWLDVTSRDDRDDWLAAPRGEGQCENDARHRLMTGVRGGDVVFHFDASLCAIVAASVTHGRVERRQLAWTAPGEGDADASRRTRPSWAIRLRESTLLEAPVPLAEIARVQWELYPALRALEDEVGDPLHYPFEMGNRDQTRPLDGYVLKLPAMLVEGIPVLLRGASRWPGTSAGDELAPALASHSKRRESSLVLRLHR